MWEPYVKQTNDGWVGYVKDSRTSESLYVTVYGHTSTLDTFQGTFFTKWGAARKARKAAKRNNIRDYSQMEKV